MALSSTCVDSRRTLSAGIASVNVEASLAFLICSAAFANGVVGGTIGGTVSTPTMPLGFGDAVFLRGFKVVGRNVGTLALAAAASLDNANEEGPSNKPRRLALKRRHLREMSGRYAKGVPLHLDA